MADETPHNVMNLDLNLGPVVSSSRDHRPETMNFIDWLDGSVREVIGHRTRARQRWRRSVWAPVPVPMGTRNMALGLETGEGSVAPALEEMKTCENGNGYLENKVAGEEEDVEKRSSGGGGGCFFDCNICLDLASDPVVTCCGHLFCWSCLYRWLHDTKECPICKGEVTIKSVTPIYGRGNPTHVVDEGSNSSLKIPTRPQAKRVESWRQTIQRNAFSMPMEEMIRRLGSRFDLVGEFPDRSSSLLNRIFTSRGMRREQNTSEQPPSMDDRESISSIAAIIQSESQTVDTAVEIDSRVSSRVSDVDSGDSRAPRRRRLN